MLDSDADTWHIDLAGRTVLMLTVDYRVSLHLHGESTYDGTVILERPFEVDGPDGSVAHVDTGRKRELAPVLECFEKVVEAVTVAREDGSLAVTFTDGTRLRAASHPHFEAWDVNAPPVKIVALPGGGEPAVWVNER
jgi:Family of unknown function (DUF6188)